MRQVRRGRDPATRIAVGWTRRRVIALEAAGLTRGTIAARAGVSPSTISRVMQPDTRRDSRIVADALRTVEP